MHAYVILQDCKRLGQRLSHWLQVDLRTDYEWREDAPSQTVSGASVWRAKQVSRDMYEVTSWRGYFTMPGFVYAAPGTEWSNGH